MSNLLEAAEIIKRCNAKFRNGCANQPNSFFDSGQSARQQMLNAQRKKLFDKNRSYISAIRVFDPGGKLIENISTLQTRADGAARLLDEDDSATIGNCGERSYWAAYKLRKKGVKNVSVLTGSSKDSINHDFVVLGATDIPDSDSYSESAAPKWQGTDIVICDPWFQAETFSYKFGIAYPLDEWPKWMPKIIQKTLDGREINRNQFKLYRT